MMTLLMFYPLRTVSDKFVEIEVVQSEYVRTDGYISSIYNQEQPQIYYVVLNLDNTHQITIDIGTDREAVKPDTQGYITVYKDTAHKDWCLSYAEAVSQVHRAFMIRYIQLIVFLILVVSIISYKPRNKEVIGEV